MHRALFSEFFSAPLCITSAPSVACIDTIFYTSFVCLAQRLP